MNILVINSGSSSIKYKLFDMQNESVLAAGIAERIGESLGAFLHTKFPGRGDELQYKKEAAISDHTAGMLTIIELVADSRYGVVKEPADILAVGHRVVHGGEAFRKPAIIDERVIRAIEKTSPLAPLHNPANLMGIRVARSLMPEAAQAAVFDTAFHQTLPPYAYHYGLPYRFYEELGVRRYGFHGTSHQYVAKEAARLLDRPLSDCNLITAHLGSGASICAIEKGESIDTSMGMTPLAGVMMGTRGGDLDPGVLLFLAEHEEMSFQEINRVLQHESGLKGICGKNDVRDVHARIAEGDQRAKLALDMFIHRFRFYLGAYFFELGRVDALVFTAGIGEHDSSIRERCCRNMESFGVLLDPDKNKTAHPEAFSISNARSSVRVFVIPTNEELEIARQTRDLLESKSNTCSPKST